MLKNSPLIAFDLEGPLSPNDNAYELMQLFPGGDHLFQVMSRYDDLLTIEGRTGYEPGDTLALIIPFLIRHGVSEADILRLAETAKLTQGSTELISRLEEHAWRVYLITTTYCPYARHLAGRLGLDPHNVYATVVPIEHYRQVMTHDMLETVARLEDEIGGLQPEKDDETIKQKLDGFFWDSRPELRRLLQETAPMGGRRKLLALRFIAFSHRLGLNGTVAVGDSITDCRMLEGVEQHGGLAIAFNANQYALPSASMSLASTDIMDLWPVLDAWASGGRNAAMGVVKARESAGGHGDRGYFHWLSGYAHRPLGIHRRIRRIVRERAAELG